MGQPDGAWPKPTWHLKQHCPSTACQSNFAYEKGNRSHAFEGLSVDEEGVLRITVRNADTGEALAESHPMVIRKGAVSGYWGDMHGQIRRKHRRHDGPALFRFCPQ